MLEDNFQNLLCHEFEDLLSDYLEGALDKEQRRRVAAHALRCPVCHELLNDVKSTLESCRASASFEFPHIGVAATTSDSAVALEARILQKTMPEIATPNMSCSEFEELLTDYLDGYLPASIFHRWERHAALCESCTNLPGEVVRSIGACYSYKANELLLPDNLHERILCSTLGTTQVKEIKMSLSQEIKQKFEDLFKSVLTPVFNPQFASIAIMLLMAFVVFTNVEVADNSIGAVYQKGVELAAQTYQQSADVVETGLTESLNLNQIKDLPSAPVTEGTAKK